MSNDIIEMAKANHKKVMEKFEKAGGQMLFYDANKIKDKKIKPFLIATTEEKLEENMNLKLKENLQKYREYIMILYYCNHYLIFLFNLAYSSNL